MSFVRVALVVPDSGLALNDACPPLNLGYLASYLRKCRKDVEIKIVDGVAHQPVREILLGFNPDIVGVTATTPQAPSAYQLADWVKQNLPYAFTVMGGVHASALPKEALEHFDCVVVGEGEKALVEIVEAYECGYRWAGVIDGEYIRNLDEIPMPAYDLINVEEYLKHGPPFPFGLKNPKTVSLVTSRGCFHRCPFCRNSSRKEPVRYFSAKRVVDEIEYFITKHHVDSVFFNDDEFLINKARLFEIKRLLKERGLLGRFVWGCQARVKTLNEETLRLVKSMGCVVVSPGFESYNPRMLNFLKCGTTKIEDNENALKVAEKVGMTIGGSFIFGTPSETLAEMRESWKWFENRDSLAFIGINTIIPYPNTTIWEICKSKGLLPKNLDYTRLVPTSVPKKTYIVCDTMPHETFNRFIVDIQRVAWILTQLRLIRRQSKQRFRDFLGLAQFKTFWWMLAFHPSKLLCAFRNNIVGVRSG